MNDEPIDRIYPPLSRLQARIEAELARNPFLDMSIVRFLSRRTVSGRLRRRWGR
jgi:hypothetical protein